MDAVRLFRFADAAVGALPEALGRAVFDAVGTVAGTLPSAGVRRLRANQARIRPGMTPRQSRALARRAMRSYMRYYYEALRLPRMSREQIRARVRIDNSEWLREKFAEGQAAAAALMHSGNWDLAGAWAEIDLVHVHTLAEKLEPQELYDFFVGYRTAVGMSVYPAGVGAIHRIEEAMREGACLAPILADRDLTASGVEVKFFGCAMLVAAGPALLAQRVGVPVYPVFSFYEKISGKRRRRAGTRWGMRLLVGEPVCARTDASSPSDERAADIARMSQEWISQFEPWVSERLEDWHMLQKVFVEDLDPERLARTRRRAAEAVRAQPKDAKAFATGHEPPSEADNAPTAARAFAEEKKTAATGAGDAVAESEARL